MACERKREKERKACERKREEERKACERKREEERKACERKLKEAERKQRHETTTFRLGFRQYASDARKCILSVYNDNRPRGVPKATPAMFMEASPELDVKHLVAAFETVGISYREKYHLERAIRVGDSIAHKFNTENHAELTELLRNMRFVEAEHDDKEAFKRLAKVWKNTLCQRSEAGTHRPYV